MCATKIAVCFRLISSNSIELESVDEIGEKIASSVIEFFSDKENIEMINTLKSYDLQFKLEENNNETTSEILIGKSIVVSGVFEKYSRDELKKLGLKSFGKNILISRNTKIYDPEKLSLKNFVDFFIDSGRMQYTGLSGFSSLTSSSTSLNFRISCVPR